MFFIGGNPAAGAARTSSMTPQKRESEISQLADTIASKINMSPDKSTAAISAELRSGNTTLKAQLNAHPRLAGGGRMGAKQIWVKAVLVKFGLEKSLTPTDKAITKLIPEMAALISKELNTQLDASKIYPYTEGQFKVDETCFKQFRVKNSIDSLQQLSAAFATDMLASLSALRNIADAHGISYDELDDNEIKSNLKTVITRLAATIDYIHRDDIKLKADTRSELCFAAPFVAHVVGGGSPSMPLVLQQGGGGPASNSYVAPVVGGRGDARTTEVLESITTLKRQMDTYLAQKDVRGIDPKDLGGPNSPQAMLLGQLLQTVEGITENPTECLDQAPSMGIVRLKEISRKLDEIIKLITPFPEQLNRINDILLKDYFGNLQFAIAFDNQTLLASPPPNIVQGQNSIDTLMSEFRQGGLQKVDLRFTVKSSDGHNYVDGTLLHATDVIFLKLDRDLIPIPSGKNLKQQLEDVLSSGRGAGVSISIERTCRIEDLDPIRNTFNQESCGEWAGLLTKFTTSEARLTPKDKTTLYMTAKTMAYYFPSIPPTKESLSRFLGFFSSGNSECFTVDQHLLMASDGQSNGAGAKGWNSKNIQNIYGKRALSDEFFQSSFTDFPQFNLMPSDDVRLTNSDTDKKPFRDKCFMFKTEGGAHDYGIMFKDDKDEKFAVVLDSSTTHGRESYQKKVAELAIKLGFNPDVQIVKPLTAGVPNFLYEQGGMGVQNMCRYTPAVYSGTEFTRSTVISLSEAPFTAAFSRAFESWRDKLG